MDRTARPAPHVLSDLAVDGDRLRVDAGLPGDWAQTLWREIAARPGPRAVAARPLPDGGEAMVKVYHRRKAHGLLRRLRPGRALREGRGYEQFARLNLPIPRLLLYGEHRPRGLHAWGVVVTARIDAPTVAEACDAARDPDLLRATIALLASTHNAGLSHGDAVTRNVLATRPVPTLFDLASWGRADRRSRDNDLVRLLGSVTRLGASRDECAALLAHYGAWAAAPCAPTDGLLDRAAAYAAATERP